MDNSSISAGFAVCIHCASLFETPRKNGAPADSIGPYCAKKECQQKYVEECSALFDVELSYAVEFALDHDMLQIVSDYPEKAKQIIKLLQETASWYPRQLSKEAASHWKVLNDKFKVFRLT